MPARAVLSIASDVLQLRREAADSAGTLSRWFGRSAPSESQAAHSTWIAGDLGTLPASIEAALSAVGLSGAKDLANMQLAVSLGFTHCRVALLAVSGVRETEANLRRVVQAWAQTRLHVNPSEHDLRWERMPGGGRYLVSCVRKDIVDALRAFAAERKIQLASVQPAVLAGLDEVGKAHKADGKRRDLVWIEGAPQAGRDHVAQVFSFGQDGLMHEWRGQVGADAGADGWHLLGLLRRLHATHGIEAGELVRHDWPAAASAAA